MLKVLNLYAGIGGNRKLWNEVDVTAIEIDPKIAKIYSDFFPDDKVIITDAHEYLLKHFKEYDFIWSSPPCPTHSRLCTLNNAQDAEMKYPDMKLYEEIILLSHFFRNTWVIENVISYYKPLVKPHIIANHYFWSNISLPFKQFEKRDIKRYDDKKQVKVKEKKYGFSLVTYNIPIQRKHLYLKNCVNPKVGKYVFDCAFKIKQENLVVR